MSTSLLYHGFGIQGDQYVRTIYRAGKIIFSIKPAPFSLRCPVCGSKRIKRRRTNYRVKRSKNTIWPKNTKVHDSNM